MRAASLAVLLIGSLVSSAFAGDYPSRPITIVVPYDPGGAVDLYVRAMAPHLQQFLGQPIIVENRSGANGVIGTAYTAKSRADGYTLMIGSNSTHALNPFLYKALPYDPVADFQPITLVHRSYFTILVAPAITATSLPALIELAKTSPHGLNAASGTANSYLANEMFGQRINAPIENVSYKSAPAALQDLLANRCDFSVTDLGSAKSLIDAGQLRALAVLGPERNPSMPTVPDAAEAGVPGFIVNNWSGILAPKGVPQPIVLQLNAAFRDVLGLPDVAAVIHASGAAVVTSTPEDFEALIRHDVAEMGAAAKAAKLEPQ
jgi:tripartite-type tricarboxylate transporter receptor subunit TctC